MWEIDSRNFDCDFFSSSSVCLVVNRDDVWRFTGTVLLQLIRVDSCLALARPSSENHTHFSTTAYGINQTRDRSTLTNEWECTHEVRVDDGKLKLAQPSSSRVQLMSLDQVFNLCKPSGEIALKSNKKNLHSEKTLEFLIHGMLNVSIDERERRNWSGSRAKMWFVFISHIFTVASLVDKLVLERQKMQIVSSKCVVCIIFFLFLGVENLFVVN